MSEQDLEKLLDGFAADALTPEEKQERPATVLRRLTDVARTVLHKPAGLQSSRNRVDLC
jgi:hypothetical protein